LFVIVSDFGAHRCHRCATIVMFRHYLAHDCRRC
jgi:hypothetical protein